MSEPGPAVRFGTLGPLCVLVNEDPVPLGSPQLRLVLAALLVHADAVVPADQIAETIWGDTPPASASGTVQKLIYRLRGLVGGGSDGPGDQIVTTRAPGYVLHTSATNYDARRFAILTADAQQANRRRAGARGLATARRSPRSLARRSLRGIRIRGVRSSRSGTPRRTPPACYRGTSRCEARAGRAYGARRRARESRRARTPTGSASGAS